MDKNDKLYSKKTLFSSDQENAVGLLAVSTAQIFDQKKVTAELMKIIVEKKQKH